MLALIRAVQTFDEVFVLTGGGPGSATTFVVQFIYQTGFQEPGAAVRPGGGGFAAAGGGADRADADPAACAGRQRAEAKRMSVDAFLTRTAAAGAACTGPTG